MTPIELAGRQYGTLQAAKTEISALLQGHKMYVPLDGRDAELAQALFDRHPDREVKAAGRPISHFEIRKNGPEPKNRGLHVVFEGGGSSDYSYLVCLTPPTREARVRAALRREIRDDCSAFFYANGGRARMHELDHMPPTFDDLVKDFCLVLLDGWDDPRLDLHDPPDGFGSELADRGVASVWRRQHLARANMQVITKEEHKRLTRERKQK